MSSEHIAHDSHEEGADHQGMTKKRILVILLYLSIITAIEFAIALIAVPHGLSVKLANPFYVALTLLKAYLIVAFFMHLKFEKSALIYTMIVPILFIVGLILVLTNESHYWIELRKVLPF